MLFSCTRIYKSNNFDLARSLIILFLNFENVGLPDNCIVEKKLDKKMNTCMHLI